MLLCFIIGFFVVGCTPEASAQDDFAVSGTVFLSVVGILVLVIVVLTLMIACIVFYSVKSKYYRGSKGQMRHSMAGK